MKSLLKALLPALLLCSCVEPFQPDIRDYSNLLVVDGFLTTEYPAARVKLARSFPYDQNKQGIETGALVSVVSKNGSEIILSEKSPGQYYSDNSFMPEPGETYKLSIKPANGGNYESGWQSLIPSQEIDSIYYVADVAKPGNYGISEGIHIYVDAHGAEEDSRYYKWEWEETWEILAPVNLPPKNSPCYQSSVSSIMEVSSTANLRENAIKEKKLFFIPVTQPKLNRRYSLNVKQYALTRDNYVYLEKLKKINEASGGFFDPIPAALTGNIRNTEQASEPVLGIFEASAVTTRRIFINREQLPFRYIDSGFSDCVNMEISKSDYKDDIVRDWIYVFEYFNYQLNDTLVFLVNARKCYDCETVGTRIIPEYWE